MKNRVARIFVATVAASALISPAWLSAAPPPVAAEDLFKLAFVSDTQIPPDARHVAFVVERMNGPDNDYSANLWVADLARSSVRQITHGNHDDAPAWSPDSSTLAFVRSRRGGRPLIFAYRMASGATTQLTRLTAGASNPLYSHSGKFIAFRSTATDPQHAAYVDFTRAGFAPKKKQRTSDVRFISHMHFESNGAGYVYARHTHIWRMNADGSHAMAVTGGRFSETNVHWSPDDRLLAFDSLRSYSPSLGPGDVYTVSSAGGAMRRMESAQPANALLDFDRHGNLWVASGGYLDPAEYPALTIGRPDGSSKRTLISKNSVAFGDIVLADMGEPGGACGPLFAPGDAFAITNVNGPGYSKLVKLDPGNGHMTDLTGSGGEAAACSLDASGKKLAYTYSDFTHLRDVYVLDLASGKRTRISSFNDAYLSGVKLSQPQPFTVKDDAGFDVQAWFMPATGGNPGAKHPTLLDIHGGPQTQFGSTFFHEFQVWTSLGY
ncbi:MAG: hypothetical protein M3M96_02125, partial [Candidatus Eremiobacteraeota bacterium]|nr:hypothetical protein [Candidatus Eremiobacteraeota bacterium]